MITEDTDLEYLIHERIVYGEPCLFCNSRVDELGLCACGAGGA